MHDNSKHERESPNVESRGYEAFKASLLQSATEREARCKETNEYLKKTKNKVAVATLLFVALYTVITVLIWCESRQANLISKKNFTNSSRSWVGLDEKNVVIDNLDIAPSLSVRSHYFVHNFGNGVATKVSAIGFFWTDGKTYRNLGESICNLVIPFTTGNVTASENLANPGPMGYILFPGQSHEEYIGAPDDPWQGAGEPSVKHVWFIGCISYLDQFQMVHWTRFCEESSFTNSTINNNTKLQFCALYNDTDQNE